jgi:hypothetical protein
MKKLLLVLSVASIAAMAQDSWTGYIVDKNCAKNKAMWSDEACSKKCLDNGAKAVFVTEEGKVYQVADQDKVKAHGGHKVTLTGKMDGETIHVDNVKM